MPKESDSHRKGKQLAQEFLVRRYCTPAAQEVNLHQPYVRSITKKGKWPHGHIVDVCTIVPREQIPGTNIDTFSSLIVAAEVKQSRNDLVRGFDCHADIVWLFADSTIDHEYFGRFEGWIGIVIFHENTRTVQVLREAQLNPSSAYAHINITPEMHANFVLLVGKEIWDNLAEEQLDTLKEISSDSELGPKMHKSLWPTARERFMKDKFYNKIPRDRNFPEPVPPEELKHHVVPLEKLMELEEGSEPTLEWFEAHRIPGQPIDVDKIDPTKPPLELEPLTEFPELLPIDVFANGTAIKSKITVQRLVNDCKRGARDHYLIGGEVFSSVEDSARSSKRWFSAKYEDD